MFSLVVRTGFSLLFSNMSWAITASLPTLYELFSKSLWSMSSGRRIFHGLLRPILKSMSCGRRIFHCYSGLLSLYEVWAAVVDPDPHGSTLIWDAISGSAFWMRIRIQEGKNDTQILKQVKNCHVLKCWMTSLLRAEGFSCSLCVLYGGLRISKLQFSIQKI